jgi:hypothetical protein
VRNPVRSETDALYLAFGGAALIGASLALGALVEPLLGVGLFVGALAGGFVWEITTKDPERRRPFREAAAQGRLGAPAERRRVLVVANRTLEGEDLRDELRRRAAEGAELYVVAPIIASRTHYLASDVDNELVDARRRLAAALDWAQAEGIDATGNVGDPNAAFGAIEDVLRVFGADEVIISTHPRGKSNWLETGIVGRLREELDIPVTHMEVEVSARR